MTTAEYLKADIARMGKQTRTATLIGAILTLIVLVYTGLGVWYAAVLTNPEDMANFITAKFSMEAPKVIGATEMKLMASAPGVADNLSKALQQAIPDFRFKAQDAIDAIIDKQFHQLETSLLKISTSYFEAHKADFPLQGRKESVEAYANRVANALCDQFGKDIDAHLKASMGADLADINYRSRAILEGFQKHLSSLSQADFKTLSRENQLERMLIAHVINKYLSTLPRP